MRAFGLALWMAAVTAVAASGKTGLLGIAALGEAPSQDGYDMLATTGLPQIGFAVEYRTPFLALFNTPTVGYYNGRPVLEDYLGVEVGWDIGWARPALSGGIGAQAYWRKKFSFQSDDYTLQHEVRFPRGIGFRLWLFQSFYGEWQGRMFQEARNGVPMWKMEFGYKLI